MGLTVADVVVLPSKHDYQRRLSDAEQAENDTIDLISSLKLSPEKVVGMVEINTKELENIIRDRMGHTRSCEFNIRALDGKCDCETIARIKDIIDTICSNKSKILGVKGKHEKESM